MDIIAKYRLIKKLENVIRDKGSSDSEKENARIRIEEIKQKLNEYSIWLHRDRIIKNKANKIKNKPNISVFKKNFNRSKDVKSRNIYFFPIDSVFGWDKKVVIEVESIFDDINKVVFLEWKCPSCGGHVERIITQKHRARLLGRPNGIRNFIEEIRIGLVNQLCNECYEKYR